MRVMFGLVTLIQHAYQIYHEVAQARRANSLLEHFDNFWNYNDAVWLTLCPFVVIFSMPKELMISSGLLCTMSAFATFSMLIKVMDWMRIFSFTSFYIFLILQTLKRISAFLLLVILSLLIFGIPLVMLDMNRIILNEGEAIPEVSSFWLPNILINQYLLALGEF